MKQPQDKCVGEANAVKKWFYIFQEFWCFTLVAIKWSLGFTLVRIAGGIKWVEFTIYICLALVTSCTGGTGMYLFFQCWPVQKNWYVDMPGSCQPREIQTALSYLVAAISILTDWTFALLPILLLWNVQMKSGIKVSVIFLLSLGIFASVAPIVRLRYLLGLNDLSHFFENLSPILAWAAAEANIGMLVANLPACRPLLSSMLSLISTRNSRNTHSTSLPPQALPNYFELGDSNGQNKSCNVSTDVGVETRMYGAELDGGDDEGDLMGDDGSQKRILVEGCRGGHSRGQKQSGTEVSHV